MNQKKLRRWWVIKLLVCGIPWVSLSQPPTANVPPTDLVRRVAERETQTELARASYTYQQSVELAEWNSQGQRGGLYTETRDVLFSPEGERRESFTKKPNDTLRFLKLTPEDFADLREVQPALITSERLPLYRARVKGAETIEGVDCWVIALEPRQILEGQRFFSGMIWVSQGDFSITRTEGKAVPALVRRKNGQREENLFPGFSTIRQRMPDGYWFPALTIADDDLAFQSGVVRVHLKVGYSAYKRFVSESTIKFANPPE